MRPAPTAARRFAADNHVRYLDEPDNQSVVIRVKHVRPARGLRDTTANPVAVRDTQNDIHIANQKRQKEVNDMMQFKKGMMVVRHEDQQHQSEQQRIALFSKQSSFVRQTTTQQRRRFQRGMMVVNTNERY
jgi:hypothetical protein